MKQITPTQLHQHLQSDEKHSVVLLDVREPLEFRHAHIAGSIHIPMQEVPRRLTELSPDAEIVVICHHGMRSAQVAGFLEGRGFSNVTNLSGGIDAWSVQVDPSLPRYQPRTVIAVIQRVSRASVDVADERIATIGRGILALVAVEKGDAEAQVERLAERLLGYRVFPDSEGRMNLSLAEIGGELLLVSQFTLAADTAKGRRPSFTPAAEPALGAALFDALVDKCRRHLGEERVACGRFGADMLVSLANDGPVTFILKAPPDQLPH